MALQAFADESYTQFNGMFTLAGYMAPAAEWAKFSDAWAALLPEYGTVNKSAPSGHHFKMSEMWAPSYRVHLQKFHDVIEQYVKIAFSMKINMDDMARARDRVIAFNADPLKWGDALHPYRFANFALIDMLQNNASARTVIGDEAIDFIFDEEQSHKKVIQDAWDQDLDAMAEKDRDKFGSSPRFEKDIEYLPLQAADFWAWWTRRWYEAGEDDERLRTLSTDEWHARNPFKFPRIAISYSEDEMVTVLMKLQQQANPHLEFADAKALGLSQGA